MYCFQFTIQTMNPISIGLFTLKQVSHFISGSLLKLYKKSLLVLTILGKMKSSWCVLIYSLKEILLSINYSLKRSTFKNSTKSPKNQLQKINWLEKSKYPSLETLRVYRLCTIVWWTITTNRWTVFWSQ